MAKYSKKELKEETRYAVLRAIEKDIFNARKGGILIGCAEDDEQNAQLIEALDEYAKNLAEKWRFNWPIQF